MMKSSDPPLTDERQAWRYDAKAFADLVGEALKEAAPEAIADHHRAGNPVAIWRDGQVVLWYPDGSFWPVTDA